MWRNVDLHAKLVALQVQDRTEERKRLNDCLHAGVAQAQWGVGVRDTARARCAAPRRASAQHPPARLGAAQNEKERNRQAAAGPRPGTYPHIFTTSPDGIIGWDSHVARGVCAALHHTNCSPRSPIHLKICYARTFSCRGTGCCPRRLFDGVLPEPSSHEHVYVPLGWQRSRRAYQARSAAAR